MEIKNIYVVYDKEFTDIEEAKAYEEKLKNDLKLRVRNLYLFYWEMTKYPGYYTALDLIRNFTKGRQFTFGQYKGRYIGEIIIQHPSYIDWCIENINSFFLNKEEEALLNTDRTIIVSEYTTNMSTFETTFNRDRYDYKLICWEKSLYENNEK